MSFDCPVCGSQITGTDCAFTLSRICGVKALQNSHSWCTCRWVIRAKEVRDHYFSGYINDDQNATAYAYIYCETIGGEGHVYYGNFDTCSKGNGTTASNMSSIGAYKRYTTFTGN